MVKYPQEYKWSSYRAYIGKEKIEWLNTKVTLEQFGNTLEEKRKRYQEFVEERLEENPLKEMVYGAILGSENFIKRVQKRLKAKPEDKEIAKLDSARKTMSMEYIVKKIREKTGASITELRRKGSKRNDLRSIAIYMCYMNCNKTNREIGAYFGGIDTTSVSTLIKRFKEKMHDNKLLREQFNTLKNQIIE